MEYTFDNFVVGNSNALAHSISKDVARNPGKKIYNPLFLYGKAGCGKTHLLKAIANYIHENSPKIDVIYVTASDFVNEYIETLKMANKSDIDNFKRKYRGGILVLDDIQFLSGKNHSQQTLIYTLKELELMGKQIVIASDLPPKDLPAMDEILKSLFIGGVTAEIRAPEYQTRLEILHNLQEQYDDVEFEEEALIFVARNICANVRALEGAFRTLYIYKKMQMNNAKIELKYEEILADYLVYEEKTVIEPEDIIDVVMNYFNIERKVLCGRTRTRDAVIARKVAMYLMREVMGLSFSKIGQYFKKTHSTVISSLGQMNSELREEDSAIKQDVIKIMQMIGL